MPASGQIWSQTQTSARSAWPKRPRLDKLAMNEDISLPFDLPAIARKKVKAAFDGGWVTSDGGGFCSLKRSADWALPTNSRLTAAMILSGSVVHTKGLASSLVSFGKRLMAAWRSTIEQKTPRLRCRLDSFVRSNLT